MIVNDNLYGSFVLSEPVLQDLLQSKALKRLKGVYQHGISDLIGLTQPITRLDHSIGAMLIVRQLGGQIEEQIAALLHDVSHTAFSHVIDHVFGSPDRQSYHDRMKNVYVAGTDIPKILAKHGYHWPDFLNEDQYTLLEQPAPRLCADRIDYFLRDSIAMGLAGHDDVAHVLSSLKVVNGRIGVEQKDTARWIGLTYMEADDRSWSNFFEVGIYELTAQAIRTGLQNGALSTADIWQTDRVVWQKLLAHPDPVLQNQLSLVSPNTQILWDEKRPTFTVSTKIRTIDPDVVVDEVLRPLSELDFQYGAQRQAYLDRKVGRWPMRVEGGKG